MGLQPQYLWDGKTSNATAAPVGPFFVVATIKTGLKPSFCGKKGFYGDKPFSQRPVQIVRANNDIFPDIRFPFFIMAGSLDPFPAGYSMGNSGAIIQANGPSEGSRGSRPVFSPIPCASVFPCAASTTMTPWTTSSRLTSLKRSRRVLSL